MGLRLTVTVKLNGFLRLKKAIDSDLRLSQNEPIRRALNEWKSIIARFLTARWARGDNWKALNEKYRAWKIKKGLLPYTLRATDQLFQAFAPAIDRKPSRVTEDIPLGIRVGFGGGMSYPHSTAHVPMSMLAMWHQVGAGNLPERKIIVPPDAAARKEMRAVMQAAMVETAREAA